MKKVVSLFIAGIFFFSSSTISVIETSIGSSCVLPPPQSVNMTLEESLFRRCSVRIFSTDPVSDQELSTILWAAYGYINGEKRTVHGINGIYGAHIYVFKQDAVYKYEPTNHTLLLFKTGDYRHIAQYVAPIVLGLTWDKNISSDENLTGAEIGEIGQNIQLITNALNLGSVINVGTNFGEVIGLSSNEVAKILIPLGRPKVPYDFKDRPLVFSLLPRVQYSGMNLTAAIKERNEASSWNGELTRQEEAQLIWSSYGYSYFLDITKDNFSYHINRHRTVPSAHGYYPLQMYIVIKSGVYRYIPNIYNPFIFLNYSKFPYPVVTFLMKIRGRDHRSELAQASSQPGIASAPLSIISVLDIKKTLPTGNEFNISGPEWLWLWYYEAGSSAYNVLLEATAWNLSANIVLPTDTSAIRSLVRLDENFAPLFIVPVGK